MGVVRVNDVRLFYQDLGERAAPAIVLIMGWGGDHTAWAFQLQPFAREHRVVALDNRGAGQSDQPDIPYTVAGMAEDTVGLMDALGIDKAHLCGASMGGMIAQEIALRHPERALTLGLHGSLARPDGWSALLMQSLLRLRDRGDREEFARALLPWLLCRRTVNDRADFVELMIRRALDNPFPPSPAGLRRQAEAVAGHDTLGRLAGIRMPTLITVGVEDILVPPSFSREMQSLIPGAEMVVIPGAGHAHFLEQPEAFNETCLGFFARQRDR